MNFKEVLNELDSLVLPKKAFFINQDLIHVNFTYHNYSIPTSDSLTSLIHLNLPSPQPITLVHSNAESLTAYSSNRKAILHSIQHSPNFPVNTPKASKENVVSLQVFEGQKQIISFLLNETNGNFQKHETITSGLKFSPDSNLLVWTVSSEKKFQRESKLGYTIEMEKEKDYGEDIDKVYQTKLAIFNINSKKISTFSTNNYGTCQYSFISNSILLLQMVKLESARLLGLRSYENRPFHLFALDLETLEFKLISNLIHIQPNGIQINENQSRIFSFRFPDGFGGHKSPVHIWTAILDLKNLTISEINESKELIYVVDLPDNPFYGNENIIVNIGERGLVFPVLINLSNFSIKKISIPVNDLESLHVDDYLNDVFLFHVSSLISIPRIGVFKENKVEYLTEKFIFNEFSFSIEKFDKDFDSIVLLTNSDEKKFIVLPHGGPRAMEATEFHRNAILFGKCGYSVAFVNYRGSVGYPFDVVKSLVGKVGEQDVADVVEVIRKLREKYQPKKIGVYGHSHGGFLALHVAGQFSNEVDFVVAGAPVTNFVSLYYSSDIPDWTLVESGVKVEADGEIEMNQEIMNQLWSASPIRYVSNINVPVLLVHGRNDRRVPYQQSIDMFNGLKRHQKKVGLLLYSGNNHSFLIESSYNDYLVSVVSFFEDSDSFLKNLEETL